MSVSHSERDVKTHLPETTWSDAFLAANRSLHQLRIQLGCEQDVPVANSGWLDCVVGRLHEVQERGGEVALPLDASKDSHNEQKSECEQVENHVRIYPSLAHAALQQSDVPAFRLWLLMRHFDRKGRGWVSTNEVVERFGRKASQYRLCGQRRLRQILRGGDNRFWMWRNGRIWLFGAARLCERMQVTRLSGRPVRVPLSGLVDRIKVVKAHLYGTVHSRRTESAPISRTTLQGITGVSERSQREYDVLLNTERTACYHLGDTYTDEGLIECHWRHANGFQFKDVHGRHGKAGALYIARRLGNRYCVPGHQAASIGRKKKINRHLNGLVTMQAQGNSQDTVERLYFRDGATASAAVNRKHRSSKTVYWVSAPDYSCSNRSSLVPTVYFSMSS